MSASLSRAALVPYRSLLHLTLSNSGIITEVLLETARAQITKMTFNITKPRVPGSS